MNKTNKVLIFIAVVLAVMLIIIGLTWYFQINFQNQYYAVYLNTGDLYFGKLSRFPNLSLSNIWYLQRDTQNGQTSLVDFSKSSWGPENKIEISKDKVVWMSRISPSSPLIAVIDGTYQVNSQQPTSDQNLNNQEPKYENSTSSSSTPSRN